MNSGFGPGPRRLPPRGGRPAGFRCRSAARAAAAGLLATLLATGCATRKEVVQFQADHEEFRGRLDRIETELDRLNTRVDTLTALLGGNVGEHFANQEEFLRSMRADQRAVSAEIEQLVQTLAARVSDSDVHVRRLVAKLDEVNRLVTEIVANRDSLALSSSFDVGDPEKLYHQAYLDFSQGENELARLGFRQYLQLYPKTSLADNALYWIGETFLAEGEQDSALAAFEALEERFPASNKTPAALLKRGILLAARGETTAARELFNRVQRDYPESAEAAQARVRLEELGESGR